MFGRPKFRHAAGARGYTAAGADPARSHGRASSDREMTVFLRIAWVNLVGIAGTVAALLPLLDRRRPVGTRRAVTRPDAPVIPIAARRRAQSR